MIPITFFNNRISLATSFIHNIIFHKKKSQRPFKTKEIISDAVGSRCLVQTNVLYNETERTFRLPWDFITTFYVPTLFYF